MPKFTKAKIKRSTPAEGDFEEIVRVKIRRDMGEMVLIEVIDSESSALGAIFPISSSELIFDHVFI